MNSKLMRVAAAGALGMTAIAAGAVQIAALADVAPGEWQLKEIGGTETKSVCLADPAQLFQIQHAAATCKRTVIDSAAKAATVQYTCAAGGSGRTTLTVRSSQSIKVETQGMAGGAPFAFDYDAKRIGDCPGAAAADDKDAK